MVSILTQDDWAIILDKADVFIFSYRTIGASEQLTSFSCPKFGTRFKATTTRKWARFALPVLNYRISLFFGIKIKKSLNLHFNLV